MPNPLVSIVIPCYNHEVFVQDCIQSVIDQTYQNIELIIIDDGSKDNSIAKIEEMVSACESRFTRFEFRHRPNKGLSSTLNEAIRWCQGEYFSTIASDDRLLLEKVDKQINFLLNNHDYIAVFGAINLINNDSEFIDQLIPSKRELNFRNIFLSNYTIFAPTQMINMSALKKIGEDPYPSHLKIEDWYMWLKLSEQGKLFNMKDVFVDYRTHDNNISKNQEVIHKGRLEVLNEFRENLLYNRAFKLVQLMNLLERQDSKLFKFIFSNLFYLCDIIFLKKIISIFIRK